jgi:iron-sulfur cluster repair protein YtfE (RIC family)
MASNKLTDKELTHYINYVLGGEAYLKQEAKDDTIKMEELKTEIAATGKHRVCFDDVAQLLTGVVANVLNPHFTMLDEETLMHEMLMKTNVPSLDKLTTLLDKLHENGDLSDKSYKYIKKHKPVIESQDFKDAATRVKNVRDEAKAKLDKVSEVTTKMQTDNKNKSKTVAKGTYNSNASSDVIKLNKYKR